MGRYGECDSPLGLCADTIELLPDRHNGAPISSTLAARLAGLYRLANDALDRFEVYLGDGVWPDFTAAPWLTFTAGESPKLGAALDPAPSGEERTWYIVVRRRNRWNLSTSEVDAWSVTVDDTGAVAHDRPSEPALTAIECLASGRVHVRSHYLPGADALDARAGFWLVYAAVGADPDPDTDTPVEVVLRDRGGLAALDWTSDPYSEGQVVHVLVRTRHKDFSEDDPPVESDYDSINTTAATVTVHVLAVADPAGLAAQFDSTTGQQI